jgi:hypothetical protein
MSRFVRPSKYRHVFGTSYKKELFYDNLKVSNDAHDCSLAKVNGSFIAVAWQASGGGAFAVIPLDKVCHLMNRSDESEIDWEASDGLSAVYRTLGTSFGCRIQSIRRQCGCLCWRRLQSDDLECSD